MLILPPYQRKGHVRRLLKAIYNDLRTDSDVQEIIDPSNEFIALHDLVSLELCHKYLPNLFSKESIVKTDRLTIEMINQAREICKLTEKETRRLYEPIQFDKRRQFELTDPALEELATDPEKRKKYVTTEYENVLKN